MTPTTPTERPASTRYYGLAEAADAFKARGFEQMTVEWLKRHPEVPRVKIGRQVRFCDDLIDAYIAEQVHREEQARKKGIAPKGRRVA